MSRSFTDEGIVLRRIDYAEADRILTILTRDHGKLGVIARGVRKPGSRLAAHTDLFARSRLHLASGRGELMVLTQAERVMAEGTGPRSLGEARRAACAALIAELTDRVLEGHHPDPDIFGLVAGDLNECADAGRDPRAAVVRFARRMIDRLGYAPQLHDCASCGRRLPEAAAVFSPAGGGLLCADCAGGDPGAIECSVRVIKVLRVAAEGDDRTWGRLRLDPATLAVLETITERELEQYLDRRLRSWEVLRAIEHSPSPALRESGML
jgi:DNA repair protein RecO (recombination protein O)